MHDLLGLTAAATLNSRIQQRTATSSVIGLGYVGLPLAVTMAKAGFRTIGFDVDPNKPIDITNGHSYIDAVSSSDLCTLVKSGTLSATCDFDVLQDCDIIA